MRPHKRITDDRSHQVVQLPPDILYDIFFRVPAWDLQFQCKCVCKQWRDWISSKGFANDQPKYGAAIIKPQLKFILSGTRRPRRGQEWSSFNEYITWDLDDTKQDHQPNTIRNLKLDFLPVGFGEQVDFYIKSSCNGLLLVQCNYINIRSFEDPYGSLDDAKLFACNPITRFYVAIPLPGWRYDHSKSCHSWLIGYDDVGTRFQFALIRIDYTDHKCQAIVFSCLESSASAAYGRWHAIDFKKKYSYVLSSVAAKRKFIWPMSSSELSDNTATSMNRA